jgi:LacI family transcriptional regulator
VEGVETEVNKKQKTGKHVTLKDVAEHAGVSPMTVSNVIHENFQYVGSATRKKVELALKKLNYMGPRRSKDKHKGGQNSIGFIVVDESAYYLTDPFLTYTIGGLSNKLSIHDFTTVIHRTTIPKFNEAVELVARSVDGLCLHMAGSESERRQMVNFALSVKRPLVLFEETLPVQGPQCCRISQDDFGGGRMIADHLVARRVKKVVFLSADTTWPAVSARLEGLRAGCNAAASGVSITSVESRSESLVDAQRAIGEHLDRHGVPDAIVASNDQIGIAAMLLLQERKIQPPKDILIAGFNGFDFLQYSRPLLTTVKSQAFEMGAGGAEAMMICLREGRFLQQEIIYPVALQIGGTT